MKAKPQYKLPQMICFRITRNCNARCRFCLAPPTGHQPELNTLKTRIDWLLMHGVKTIHFCGGEPTMHTGLAELLCYTNNRNAKSKLTTNAIALNDELIAALNTSNAEVKVSLHGDEQQHNRMVGVRSFKHTTTNLNRLIRAGIQTSIQATVVSGGEWVVEWLCDYCIQHGIRRLTILPFIARGNGASSSAEFSLSYTESIKLRQRIKKRRHTLNGKLDLRLLDFGCQSLHVVEPDGNIILESANEAMDVWLGNIPDTVNSVKH